MYYLMNKDKVVAKFHAEQDFDSDVYVLDAFDSDHMPIGFKDIEDWINNRKGSKHNRHLLELMSACGCERTEGFIRITHAATINDTFWVKSDLEDVSWADVSLYRNNYNETISRLAFEGGGLYGMQLSSTSPELSTEGSFRKCWKREEDGIFLYKRGRSDEKEAGLEPYCEALASEIAAKICKESVSYEIVPFHGKMASRCRLFTDEDIGYVSYARFPEKNSSVRKTLEFYEKIGSGDAFRRMLVLDSLTFNVDRHSGNHGVLVDNNTLESIRMAPIFDMNLSLLPYVRTDEFGHIGDRLRGYRPSIGSDFTRIGQTVLTPEIRRDLINLKGFEFSFRGDENFPEERVKLLENLINRQTEALLSKEVLHTANVFVPETMLWIAI